MAPPISTEDYLKAIEHRRTVYGTSSKLPDGVDDERIIAIIKRVVITSPSSYNTQPGRYTILLGAPHKKLWDLVLELGVPLVKQHAGDGPAEKMTQMWTNFKDNCYGSVLFWDDQATIKKAAETHKASAQMFPEWAVMADAIAQIQIWTALELEGLAANLQHMNAFPNVVEALRKEFDIPATWELKANMNFGGYNQPHPSRPDKLPVEETLGVRRG